jgi:hypothetical protein
MPRKPPTNVVVITGASSAIGQALALEFAVRGDAIVLAAMSEEALETPKRSCEMLGAWTAACVVPERDEQAIREMATHAIERFGRIDIWINHAAAFERTADGDDEANGAALAAELATFDHGARTAMKVFGVQKHGVLINVDGYQNMPALSELIRDTVRERFAKVEEQVAPLESVQVHSVLTPPGGAPVVDLARSVVDLARSTARGDLLGRAAALLSRQQMRLLSTARGARRRFRRAGSDAMGLAAGSRTGDGSAQGTGRSDPDVPTRRGGWHLAYTDEGQRTLAVMALIALPILLAIVMLVLVRG